MLPDPRGGGVKPPTRWSDWGKQSVGQTLWNPAVAETFIEREKQLEPRGGGV